MNDVPIENRVEVGVNPQRAYFTINSHGIRLSNRKFRICLHKYVHIIRIYEIIIFSSHNLPFKMPESTRFVISF